MNDLEQLAQILYTISGLDTQARLESEENLSKIRDLNLNQYTDTFIRLLQSDFHQFKTPLDSFQQEAQVYCLAHLRNIFSNFVDKPDNKWHELHSDHQNFLKETLINLLRTNNNPKLSNPLSYLIGDLAATIQAGTSDKKNNGNNEWAQLDETLVELLSSEELPCIERALRVFSVLYERNLQSYTKYKEKLFNAMEKVLINGPIDLKIVAMKTICALSTMKESKELKELKNGKDFVELVRTMISQAKLIVCEASLDPQRQNLAFEALGTIADILEVKPDVIEKHHKLLIETIKSALESPSMENLKLLALEIYVLALEKLPKAFQESPEQIAREAIELVFKYMVIFDQDSTDKWENPTQETYLDDFEVTDSLEASTISCMRLIGRIVETLTKKKMARLALKLMFDTLKVKNWRTQHCALMCISQIVEFIDDPTQIDPIVFKIMAFLQSESPKVVYAAVQCLGQISENPAVNFQNNHSRTVLPSIVSMLSEQPTRIICWSLKSLASLIEGCTKPLVQQYADKILEFCIQFLGEDNPILIEGAIRVIDSIIKVCEANFSTYYDAVKEAILPVLNKADRRYENAREEAVGTLCYMDETTGKGNGQRTTYLPEPAQAPAADKSMPEKMVEVPNSDIGDVSTDYEIVPLAHARARRAGKKPNQTYEEKNVEEHKEKPEKQRKPRATTKKQKEVKIEEDDTCMEIEKPNLKQRTEVGYEWREWQLAFNDALKTLNQEEFVSFVKMVQEDRPECVSFEKGYLELKIAAVKASPLLSANTHAKTNQMMVQTKTFMEFIGYIEKIKGSNNTIVKPKPRRKGK